MRPINFLGVASLSLITNVTARKSSSAPPQPPDLTPLQNIGIHAKKIGSTAADTYVEINDLLKQNKELSSAQQISVMQDVVNLFTATQDYAFKQQEVLDSWDTYYVDAIDFFHKLDKPPQDDEDGTDETLIEGAANGVVQQQVIRQIQSNKDRLTLQLENGKALVIMLEELRRYLSQFPISIINGEENKADENHEQLKRKYLETLKIWSTYTDPNTGTTNTTK